MISLYQETNVWKLMYNNLYFKSYQCNLISKLCWPVVKTITNPHCLIYDIKILKRREECDTYLTLICRHDSSGENPVKRSFQPTLIDIHLMNATVVTESSILYFIFSQSSLRYCDVYRRESGKYRTLPFFLIFFTISPFQVFLLY